MKQPMTVLAILLSLLGTTLLAEDTLLAVEDADKIARIDMNFRFIEEDRKTFEFRYDFSIKNELEEVSRFILVAVDRNQSIWYQGEGDFSVAGGSISDRPLHIENTSAFDLSMFFVTVSADVAEELIFRAARGEAVTRPTSSEAIDYFSELVDGRVSNICKVALVSFSKADPDCG